MTRLAIVGAGGHGKVVADAAFAAGKWSEIVFFDDSEPAKTDCLGFSVAGRYADLIANTTKPDVVVAIGNNVARLQKVDDLQSHGFNVVTVIHPKAVVSPFAKIGAGTVIFCGAVVNPAACVGRAVIINTQAVVEHDCLLADGVHISPSAALAGAVVIGQCSWIGIGAKVIQQIKIDSDVIVGAGAVVNRNLPNSVTAVGVPVRVLSK